MGKPTICIGENKGADQLRGYCEADQRLCFRYRDSTIPLLSKIRNLQPLAYFCDSTGRFVSDLVGTQIAVFFYSCKGSYIISILCISSKTRTCILYVSVLKRKSELFKENGLFILGSSLN